MEVDKKSWPVISIVDWETNMAKSFNVDPSVSELVFFINKEGKVSVSVVVEGEENPFKEKVSEEQIRS